MSIPRSVLCCVMLSLSLSAADSNYPVPPPRPVRTDVRVGAYIFPGWDSTREHSEWRLVAKFAKPSVH